MSAFVKQALRPLVFEQRPKQEAATMCRAANVEYVVKACADRVPGSRLGAGVVIVSRSTVVWAMPLDNLAGLLADVDTSGRSGTKITGLAREGVVNFFAFHALVRPRYDCSTNFQSAPIPLFLR